MTEPKTYEEDRGGRRGVMVDDSDLSSAWTVADKFAATKGKRVIQNETPGFLRRHDRVHHFFPYDPAEKVPL